MGPDDTAFVLEVAVAALIVAIVTAALGACAGAARAAVHDVERALGTATLMTYAQAAMKSGKEEERCAICLLEYAAAGGDDLVRVVPACGHFFHAGCDVDRWLRARRTCPICRGGLCPLLRTPRVPTHAAARVGAVSRPAPS